MRGIARRWAPRLAEVGVFIAWSLVLIWPVTAHPSTRAAGSGDSRYWLWLGWRLAALVKSGHLPTSVPDVIWPYGSNLRVADGALPSAVGMAWNFVASPTLAFNLAVVTAIVSGALAARYLASQFTDRRIVQILCGLAFASAPALAIRLEGHYNLLFAFPGPLLVAVAVRVARDRSRVPPVRLGLLLALAYTSSGYFLFFGAVAVGVAVLAAHTTRQDKGRDLIRLGLAAAVALVVLSPTLVPKLQLERRESAAHARKINSGAEDFSSDVWSAFLPPPGERIGIQRLERLQADLGGNVLEETANPGVLSLLGIAGLVVIATSVRRPLLAAAGALWILSLGPTAHIAGKAPLAGVKWLPMAELLQLPGMAGVRAPNRASFTLAAVAVAALACSLGWTFERLRLGGRVVLVVISIVVLVAGLRSIGWSQEVGGPPVVGALEQVRRTAQPGQSLIHLPNDCLGNADQVSLQILHRAPIVGCQGFDAVIPWNTGIPGYFASQGWAALRCNSGAIGSRPVALPATFDGTPTVAAVQRLRAELHVRFVVFDRHTECPGRGEQILAALLRAGRTLGDDGRLVVLDLG